MRNPLPFVVLLSPVLMGVHCSDAADPPQICMQTALEVDRNSPEFDAAFVQAAAWQVSGTFLYSSFYPNSEPTDYELRLRWSEEPYSATLIEYCDGSTEVSRQRLPITAEFKTLDGAFDGAFPGEVWLPRDEAKYQFDPVALRDIQGTNDQAASAAELDCQEPDVLLLELSLDRKRRTGHYAIWYEGEEPLNYECNGSRRPVGIPRIEQVQRLE